jgi:Sugar (and other) transporter
MYSNQNIDDADDKPSVRLLGKMKKPNRRVKLIRSVSSPFVPDEIEIDEENNKTSMSSTINQEDCDLRLDDDNKYDRHSALLIFFFPALGGLLFGYDIGATSAVVSQLKSVNYSGVLWHETVSSNSSLQGVITAMATLGALIGSIACFRVADLLGRRQCLLLASCLYLGGAILEVVSGSASYNATTGLAVLLLGRLIYGFGCGFAMVGAPAYIGEMAPSAIRGLLCNYILQLCQISNSNSRNKNRSVGVAERGVHCSWHYFWVFFWLHLCR